jgi:dienelactone hydrolase
MEAAAAGTVHVTSSLRVRSNAPASVRCCSTSLFGASTGAAAALIAAAERPNEIAAVVSRGGRPDLAGSALGKVRAPVLLIVGGLDHQVIQLNRAAMRRTTVEVHLEIVPAATHLFEEPGTLEQVAALAAAWFTRYLQPVLPATAKT